MNLEFAEKVLEIRKALNFTQQEFADLLGIQRSVPASWETLAYKAANCWERIIQFLIDCPASLNIFRQKPWINDEVGWPARISSLRQKLGWTVARLEEFLSTENSIYRWTHGAPMDHCYKILMSLLEIYSEIDQKDWPPSLYFREEDIITPERVKLLRQGFGMKQSQLANLIHMYPSNISRWEVGRGKPGWCSNLLLRMLEAYPRSADLLEKMPWGDDRLSPEMAIQIRAALGLTRLELGRLLGAIAITIDNYENSGDRGGDCGVLVYQLLDQHPEEFLSYIQGLSNPGGQACPIW